MQRPAISAVFVFIKTLGERQHRRNGEAGLVPDPAELLDARRGRQGLMRAVQWNERDGNARLKHHTRRMWIHIDVEFGSGCNISGLKVTAAHGDDTLDARRNPGLPDKSQSDICHGAENAQRDGACLVCHQRLNDEIHRMLFLQRHLRLGPDRAVKPGLPMHMLGRLQLAQKGARCTGKDLDVGPARQFANLARVDFS